MLLQVLVLSMKEDQEIQLGQVLGINPNYVLRKDCGVGTLCEGDKVFETIPHHKNFLSHIHLFTARLFSCFDGKRTLKEAVELAADLLDIPFELCLKQTLLYINNKDVISNKIGNAWQAIPENMLVPIEDKVAYKSYDPGVFYAEKYDFTPPNRLPTPLSINILLTMKCMTDCIYCYANRSIRNHPAFDLQSIINLIRTAKRSGVVKVDINGGDVLSYPHWFEVVEALLENGYTPLISTKIPIGKKEIDKLISLGISRIQISLDTINPSVCSSLLRVQGEQYVNRVKNTLQLIDKTDIEVQINSVITCKNSDIDNMNSLVDFLARHSCVKQITFTPAGYSIYNRPYSAFAPSDKHVKALTKELDEVVRFKYPWIKFSISSGEIHPHMHRSEERFSNRTFCTANTRNAVILPDGRMTICEELYENPTFIIGDLKQESLLEAWNSEKALELFYYKQERISQNSPCSHCHNYTECHTEKGVCWKSIIMAYGEENCFFPDPLCPKAPNPLNKYWLE